MTVSEKCAGFNLIHLLPVLIQVCGRFMPPLSFETFEAQGLRLLQRRHRRRRLPVQNFHLGSGQGRARTGLGLSRVGARQSRSQGFRLMNNGGRTQRSYKVCQKEEEGVGWGGGGDGTPMRRRVQTAKAGLLFNKNG